MKPLTKQIISSLLMSLSAITPSPESGMELTGSTATVFSSYGSAVSGPGPKLVLVGGPYDRVGPRGAPKRTWKGYGCHNGSHHLLLFNTGESCKLDYPQMKFCCNQKGTHQHCTGTSHGSPHLKGHYLTPRTMDSYTDYCLVSSLTSLMPYSSHLWPTRSAALAATMVRSSKRPTYAVTVSG